MRLPAMLVAARRVRTVDAAAAYWEPGVQCLRWRAPRAKFRYRRQLRISVCVILPHSGNLTSATVGMKYALRDIMSAGGDGYPQRGELAQLIRAKNWDETPLGSQQAWPSSLRTVLRIMLSSRYAMWLGWGPELVFFYNDAYAEETLGAKHPWALGRPAQEVWAEIWDTLKIRIDHVLRTGEATWDAGLLLLLVRAGYPEETYHTFSYSPAPADDPDETGGLFCVVIEETERVINERRITFLHELASRIAQTNRAEEVYGALERCLDNDSRDMPFSATYLLESGGKMVHRVFQTGFHAEHPTLPENIPVDCSTIWPIQSVITNRAMAIVELPEDCGWPTGPWKRCPSRAVVLPIARQGQLEAAGVYIAGANPHRPLDLALRSFVELVVGQFAAGLANARAYEEAERRAETLAELDRAKTVFFSNVSHEFRTPLTLMLGPMEDALGNPERALVGDELETVHRNALRLLKLVNALLDFARIEAGRIEASYEPIDLRKLTVDLASNFRSAFERAGLLFLVECAELPEPIYVDRDMWEKIVLNLLSNALKFTFDGVTTIQLHWCGNHAQLVVEDSGVGIDAAELPRLFERFHRIENSRARTHEGSGIGLALVHELVRLHGGSIDVTSKVDAGTRFVVSIPSGTSHLQTNRIGAPSSLSSTSVSRAYVAEALRWIPAASNGNLLAPEAKKSQVRILVADDNSDMREYVARLLRQHWTVEVAADGFDALELARRTPPDLILSDVMMPRVDGFALIRELRGDSSTAAIPIILISARAGEEATAEGLRSGADDYLVKPFSASSLLVRVEAQLSAARLRHAIRRAGNAERERLDLMFRESPAAICVLRGRTFIVELANPFILKLCNKSSNVIGMPLFEAIPELCDQGFDDLLGEVLDTGVPYQGKEQRAHFAGKTDGQYRDIYADFVCVPLPGSEGQCDSVFVHAYDVTDKVLARQLSEQLREAEQSARKEAEAANRLKDEFLATMSHELRTPLNAILGWASLLRRGSNDPASLERALATIERNARTQQRLIEDVLDVSRIVSGKLSLDMRRIDLVAIARAAVDVVRPAADAKRVTILFNPAPNDFLELIGDADRFQQIMWNLLSNAVKFTPPAGRVSLNVACVGSSAHIVVRDTGAGIASEHLPFIFERFRQVDSSTTRKFSGLGLGLAIVRHLAELHGGFVIAESAGLNQGATFTVKVPIPALHGSPTLMVDAESSRLLEPISNACSSLLGITVLVADDDEDSRRLIESALGRAGASVRGVATVADALDLLVERPIDVVVSDIGMPEEDGYTLVKRLRSHVSAQARAIPAIALTAYARSEDATRALEAGFQVHLAKPADIDELTRAVVMLAKGRL